MAVLEARPKQLMSWGFNLFEGGIHVTTLNMRWFTEAGTFQWNHTPYQLGREGFRSGDFFMASENRVIARGRKTSAFLRKFRLNIQDRELILSAKAPFLRTFQLTEQAMIMGTIRPNHALTRKCMIDLPDELDTARRVFIFWLVVLMWRRTSRSND